MAESPEAGRREEAEADVPPPAALRHLTGPSRGATSWLSLALHDLTMDAAGRLHVHAGAGERAPPGALARFRRAGGGYLLETPAGREVWVGRVRVAERRLRHGDMIEFGDEGPVSRYEVYDGAHPRRSTIPDILADAAAYLRVSRRPWQSRLWRAGAGTAARLLRETTLLFRVTALLALAAGGWLLFQQRGEIARLEARLEAGASRLEAVAIGLAEARRAALSEADLDALRRDLAEGIGRIGALEAHTRAGSEVVAAAAPAVLFLQGAYGYRHAESGRMLRLVVDAEGRPRLSPFGKLLLTLDGPGPIAEREVTGTGFLVADPADGAPVLVTNRHVARAWERDAAAAAAEAEGLEPVPLRLIAYAPGRAEPLALAERRVGAAVDLALLALEGDGAGLPLLEIAERAPEVGETVLALGYATGLKAMLAQSGEAFIAERQAEGETDFWTIARRLAEAGLVRPLASRGIVGQVAPGTVVFDAGTTHGGSGGPVLDLAGRVVAVQSAILPDYGASNLGVPAAALARFLAGGDG